MTDHQLVKDLKDFIDGLTVRQYRHLEYKLKTQRPDLYEFVINSWNHDIPPRIFLEMCYDIINNDTPYCKNGNIKKFEYYTTGYVNCEKHCPCATEKYKTSMLRNHGVDSPLKNLDIKSKAQQTLLKNHGTTNLHEANFSQKKLTNLSKFGVEYPLQSQDIQNKCKYSLKENTGYNHNFENPKLMAKVRDRWSVINDNDQKTFVRTIEHGKLYSLQYAKDNFTNNYHVLFDKDELRNQLLTKSRQELANEYSCSLTMIDKQIKLFDLTEFQNTESYYEILIQNLLKENGIVFMRNTRKIIAPKELDFYIPSKNVAIEFCGLAWHGEKRGRGREYHVSKTTQCEIQNIRLLQIFQDEWDNRSDVVKDIILSSMDLYVGRLPAAKCHVRVIDQETSDEFLNTNNLQRINESATINLGLYHTSSKKLMAVMSLTKIEKHWKLERYANLTGWCIQGGISKLFSHFIKLYKPNLVMAECDRRYFTGDSLLNLNFKFVKNTDPASYYSKGNLRYSLNDIIDTTGYDRIWDCGQAVWRWNKSID